MKAQYKFYENLAVYLDIFVLESYETDLEHSKTYKKAPEDWLASRWTGFKSPKQLSRIKLTGKNIETPPVYKGVATL